MVFQITNFIDMHTHILPGMDDGAKDMAESLKIARCYERTGVKNIVATPHFLPGTAWAPKKEDVTGSVRELQTVLDQNHIDVTVIAGMEIAFHKKLEERILSDMLLPLGKSGYYLIEPSFNGEQDSLLESLGSLLQKKQKLILAHPERVDGLHQRVDELQNLVEQGLRIQANTGSLLGYFGPKSCAAAHLLRRKNCLHFIASDTHDSLKRAPLNADEWRVFLRIEGGKELLLSCLRNIKGIFPVDE